MMFYEERGEHAHRKLEQLMIAMNGSFDVVLEDGKTATKAVAQARVR